MLQGHSLLQNLYSRSQCLHFEKAYLFFASVTFIQDTKVNAVIQLLQRCFPLQAKRYFAHR